MQTEDKWYLSEIRSYSYKSILRYLGKKLCRCDKRRHIHLKKCGSGKSPPEINYGKYNSFEL